MINSNNDSLETNRPLGLGIHSSTGELGLGLWQGDRLVKQETWLLKRELLNQLQNCLQGFIGGYRWSELDFVAVARGPGSFTSVRIGMVSARTLSQQLDIPLFPISSLHSLAQSALMDSSLDSQFGVTIPATRGYLYGATFSIGQALGEKKIAQPLAEDRLWLPTDWQRFLTEQGVTHVIDAPEILGNTVGALLRLAAQQWQQGKRPHWSTAEPFYGMSPTDP